MIAEEGDMIDRAGRVTPAYALPPAAARVFRLGDRVHLVAHREDVGCHRWVPCVDRDAAEVRQCIRHVTGRVLVRRSVAVRTGHAALLAKHLSGPIASTVRPLPSLW